MQLNEADREIFNEIIDDFLKKYGEREGREILKEIYRLHRKLSVKLDITHFPATHIFYHILNKEFNDNIYQGLSFKKIAEKEGISLKTLYNFFHRRKTRKRGYGTK